MEREVTFNEPLYHEEMERLLRAARGALVAEQPPVRVYTIAIWTDPAARRSSVSVDTRAHSDARVAALAAWARDQHPRLLAAGLPAAAEAALRVPPRNVNPADFALRDLVEVRHRAFGAPVAEVSFEDVWAALESALERVGLAALELFADLPLERGAEVAVNTRRDWYGRTWVLTPPAT
jgi:hypothetical protein